MSALRIAAQIKHLLASLQEPRLAPFLTEWPSAMVDRTLSPVTLPVLRWLRGLTDVPGNVASDLVAAVCQAAPSLTWRQTYTANELDAAFLDNYGWSEILGTSGALVSERLACGFLLLGPATHYPRHRHAAEEIYLPLCGTAAWQQGDGAWRDKVPGTLIHHAGDEPHSMRTGTSPLLALYLWRGAHLAQRARLDEPSA